MKKLIYPIVLAVLIFASAFSFVKSQPWKISEDYTIKFSSSDPSGIFTGLKGDILFDEKDLKNSTFDVSVDASSINTGNGMQNNHAKSAQWFDAEKYPLIKFTSSEISKTSEGYLAKGILDLHGIQREISIPFTFSNSTFIGGFEIDRTDFDLNPSNGKAGKIIKIDLKVPVLK